jgi:hypothetical protein
MIASFLMVLVLSFFDFNSNLQKRGLDGNDANMGKLNSMTSF